MDIDGSILVADAVAMKKCDVCDDDTLGNDDTSVSTLVELLPTKVK